MTGGSTSGSPTPTISVVVAVFNAAETLQRCIDSFAEQTYAAKELIVIDGGSTDKSCEILERNEASLAYWESEPDRGIYHAWNKGLSHVHGDWVCFLGGDDFFWSADVLERMAEILARARPEAPVVYGRVALVNQSAKEVQRLGEDWHKVKRRLWQIMCLPHTGLMHRRSLFERHGAFDESFRIAADYEMLLRALRDEDAIFVPDVVVAGMGHGGVSSDPAKSLTLLREIRRAQKMHGVRRPSVPWMVAFGKAHLRVRLWRLLGPRLAPYVFDLLRMISGKGAYWTHQ